MKNTDTRCHKIYRDENGTIIGIGCVFCGIIVEQKTDEDIVYPITCSSSKCNK